MKYINDELPFLSEEEDSKKLENFVKENPLYQLSHPYSRYGLALALYRIDQDESKNFTEQDLAAAFIEEIENGLGNFRLETNDNPETAEVLRFSRISLERLRNNKSLVQGQLSKLGKYLVPTIVSTDGDARNSFNNAEKMLKILNDGKDLTKNFTLSRSFAPTTSKINNGVKSQSPPKTSTFEAICSIATTVTEIKPAAWIDTRNTVIIPDLSLLKLKEFIKLFDAMLFTDFSGKLNPYETKPKIDNKENKSFKRPPLFDGNYPFAPRNSAFGAVGLLAAIGRWSVKVNEREQAKKVLESLKGRPLYIISYDNIFQVQFSHHVINLAIKDKLRTVIDRLMFDTKIYSEIDTNKSRWDSTAYKLFDLMTNRFLQMFDKPTFQDFLATRAEYAGEVNILFEEFFMKENEIEREIVESAKAYGQWLNRTAYFVAKDEIENKSKKEDKSKKVEIQKQKAKILIEIESAIMSAETPQDMIHRVSTRAGRLLQSDAPAEATEFVDTVMSGEIKAKTAQQMLIAYLRLRSKKSNSEQ